MKTLYVAWQQPDSKEWIPVARLDFDGLRYRFEYTRGVIRAKNFSPFVGMIDTGAVYESESIFPLFANRIIAKSRPEFREYVSWLGLQDADDDVMSILSLTGGIRGTDSIEMFPPPAVTESQSYAVDFFWRRLNYLPKEAVARISDLSVGEELSLMHDCQNKFDPYAIAIRSSQQSFLLGYCPKYYSKEILSILRADPLAIKISVKCINRDAPMNMRLLCSIEGTAPSGFVPLVGTSDFQPLSGFMPQSWDELRKSLSEIDSD